MHKSNRLLLPGIIVLLVAPSSCHRDQPPKPSVAIANSTLILPQTSPTQARWYHPIDIGMHVNSALVAEERLSEDELWQLVGRESRQATEAGTREFETRRIRLAAQRPETDHSQDRSYRKFEAQINVGVYEFSHNQVRLWVTVKTGASRWHHFFDLIAWYLVDRSPSVDKAFMLVEQEAEYRDSYMGFGHGDRFMDMVSKLGKEVVEYPGQSPSFREVYYPAHNLSVTIQDGIIKKLKRQKPDWAERGTGSE